MLFSRLTPHKTAIAIEDRELLISFHQLLEDIALIQTNLLSTCLDEKIALIPSKDYKSIAIFLSLIGLGKKIYLFPHQMHLDLFLSQMKTYQITAIISEELDIGINKTALFKKTYKVNPVVDASHNASIFIFSSGSTQKEKLIQSDILAHVLSARNAIKALSISKTSRYLLSLPMHHVSGIAPIFRALLSGATLVLDYSFNKNPYTTLKKHRITHVSCVYTHLIRLLGQYLTPLNHLKAVLLGGSYFSQYMIKRAFEKKIPIFLSYGMTETNSMISCNNVLKSKNFLSCGKVFNDIKISFSKNSEVQISSEVLFKNYIDINNQMTIPPLPFTTSDIGYMDKKQNLYITHRRDHVFFSGGYNINPQRIEELLLAFNGIEKAKVLAHQDTEFGYVPIAFYYSPKKISESELLNFLKKNLNFYEVPKHLVFLDFNISETGKVSAYEAKKMLDDFQNVNQ